MRTFAGCLFALLTAAPTCLQAQQNVAIYVSRGISTISGVLCSFNCADPNNVGSATAQAFDTIDLRLVGDAGQPAVLLGGFGTAMSGCGLPFPGLGNSLLISPAELVTLNFVTAVSPGGRNQCNPTGGLQNMLTLTIPVIASGSIVTFQGVVHDNGLLSFTRAVELTIP